MKRTYEDAKREALKYKTKYEFKKNDRNMYLYACKNKILDEICQHMVCGHIKYTDEELLQEALKYETRFEFAKGSKRHYGSARHRGILDKICKHMPNKNDKYWTRERCKEEALKYKKLMDFRRGSPSAYVISKREGFLYEITEHINKNSINESSKEINLKEFIKRHYPKVTKLMDKKVNIKDKPHIKVFEIDIYIPELRKGIEFDGSYYHSFKGLKRSRPHWNDEDIRNYHKIKDDHFLSKNIEILHIKEKDWDNNKNDCIKKCLSFLNIEIKDE